MRFMLILNIFQRFYMYAECRLHNAVCLAGCFAVAIGSATAATVSISTSTTSILDGVSNSGATSSSVSVTNKGKTDTVSATASAPASSLAGADFAVSGGTGSVSVFRETGGSPYSIAGSNACSIVEFTLATGEILNWSLGIDYNVASGMGAGAPSVTYEINDTGLASTLFSGAQTCADY